MNSESSENPCVETPAAPEWLRKLENRRENLRGKLGHELGAGAPCNLCGDKCPGLDLHFWRKVCRNCKCRKDEHLCPDDDLSGWAQFEVLGQIRSKPAFIKIKAFASQPIQVEWVPPNAAPDVISDYMDKIGTSKVPVAGSDAAQKRKQQLEFQVPPHDLDAALCDNLSEPEVAQLQQYVQKIRDNCVGQGSVVRVGPLCNAVVQHMPVNDQVLDDILTNDDLKKAFASLENYRNKPLVVFPDGFKQDDELPFPLKRALPGLSRRALFSLVENGPIYDKILCSFKDKNIDITSDPKLKAISEFRKLYLNNQDFKRDIDNFVAQNSNSTTRQSTPMKQRSECDLMLNSPIPLKSTTQLRYGAQMQQSTPVRKVAVVESNVLRSCGLPTNIVYENDPIFSQIVSSSALNAAIHNAKSSNQMEELVVAPSPLPTSAVYGNSQIMNEPVKALLKALRLDASALQSVLLNGPFYDRLFHALEEMNINYEKCNLLSPLKQLHDELLSNPSLCREAHANVMQMATSSEVSFGNQQNILKAALSNSKSNDSGFDSKPSTPRTEVNALTGRYATIPGIEDMNMYPNLANSGSLCNALKNLGINNELEKQQETHIALHCQDCKQAIHLGEIAVKAERAGRDVAWHPQCFKCHTCHELLADLVYFFHAGHVYCGRDLAIKLQIPRCKACDELIFTKEYTAAEDASFHIKHFCCFHCDTPLAGHQYIPDQKSNMPLCLGCYNDYFAAVCSFCQRTIEPTDKGVSWGEVHWHGSCFNCAGANCSKSLIGGRFCVKENMPFCSAACVHSIIK